LKTRPLALFEIGHPTTIGWVITVHDWAQISYLYSSEGLSMQT
jgi:hypothetical protein